MIVFFYIFAFFAISFFALVLYILSRPEQVLCVDAGPVADANIQVLNSKTKDCKTIYLKSSTSKLSPSRYFRVLVEGNCMEPLGILTGSVLIVEKIEGKDKLKRELRPGDILLITLEDKKISKIRVYNREVDNEEGGEPMLETFYYENTKPKKSSQNHKYENVHGVVRYLLPS